MKPALTAKTSLTNYCGTSGDIPNLRSSNLWDDVEHTIVVDKYQSLDLLLFNRAPKAWGAHVAVYVGDDRAIHLSRSIGFAAVWQLAEFADHPEYRVLVGAKRALSGKLDRSVQSWSASTLAPKSENAPGSKPLCDDAADASLAGNRFGDGKTSAEKVNLPI